MYKEVSSNHSNSDCYTDSEDSDISFIPDYDIEIEEDDGDSRSMATSSQDSLESLDNCDMAYADEPLADEEWIAQYEKEVKENEDLERKLEKRLNGTEEVYRSLCK